MLPFKAITIVETTTTERTLGCRRRRMSFRFGHVGNSYALTGKLNGTVCIESFSIWRNVLALCPLYHNVLSISEMGHFLNRTLWHNQAALTSSLRSWL